MLNLSSAKIYALFDTGANKKIIAELNKIGAEIILFPPINIEIVSNIETEQLLRSLKKFDWLILTDVYAAEYFVTSLKKLEFDLFELDALRVLAFGEAVSDRLRFSQLHADVITNSIKTLDVLQALQDYIFDEAEFENLEFLVVQAQNAKANLSDELKKLNAKVTQIAIYQTKITETATSTKLKTLLKGGAADEFIFSSPSDVVNLAHLFQTEKLDEVLAETKLTAMDNQTLQTLQEFRLV